MNARTATAPSRMIDRMSMIEPPASSATDSQENEMAGTYPAITTNRMEVSVALTPAAAAQARPAQAAGEDGPQGGRRSRAAWSARSPTRATDVGRRAGP